MNTKLLIASLFVLTTFATPQEIKHAPTIQSCAADLNLWTSQIAGWPKESLDQMDEATKSLTVHELNGRISSIAECAQSYPILQKSKSGETPVTASLIDVYQLEVQQRLFNFLVRHNLVAKFTEEDDAGVR